MSRSMGKMSTETMILLGAVAVVGIYLFTRTQAVPLAGGATYLTGPGGGQYLPGNATAADIAAGGQAASSILQQLVNGGVIGN